MRELKTFGGMAFVGRTQHRCIVSARSKKRAVECLNEVGVNISAHHFNNFWCETGNPTETKIGCQLPETPCYQPIYSTDEYVNIDTLNPVVITTPVYSQLTEECWAELMALTTFVEGTEIKDIIEKYIEKSAQKSMEDNCVYTS